MKKYSFLILLFCFSSFASTFKVGSGFNILTLSNQNIKEILGDHTKFDSLKISNNKVAIIPKTFEDFFILIVSQSQQTKELKLSPSNMRERKGINISFSIPLKEFAFEDKKATDQMLLNRLNLEAEKIIKKAKKYLDKYRIGQFEVKELQKQYLNGGYKLLLAVENKSKQSNVLETNEHFQLKEDVFFKEKEAKIIFGWRY